MGHGVHIGASSRDGRGETITLVDPASGKAGTESSRTSDTELSPKEA